MYVGNIYPSDLVHAGEALVALLHLTYFIRITRLKATLVLADSVPSRILSKNCTYEKYRKIW